MSTRLTSRSDATSEPLTARPSHGCGVLLRSENLSAPLTRSCGRVSAFHACGRVLYSAGTFGFCLCPLSLFDFFAFHTGHRPDRHAGLVQRSETPSVTANRRLYHSLTHSRSRPVCVGVRGRRVCDPTRRAGLCVQGKYTHRTWPQPSRWSC